MTAQILISWMRRHGLRSFLKDSPTRFSTSSFFQHSNLPGPLTNELTYFSLGYVFAELWFIRILLSKKYYVCFIRPLSHYDICCLIMVFVALWYLSHYGICRSITFVSLWYLLPYDICLIMVFVPLWYLSHYGICRIMIIVSLWYLSQYNICLIMVFVALRYLSHYGICPIMIFVSLWYLSHYDNCLIMVFVAV